MPTGGVFKVGEGPTASGERPDGTSHVSSSAFSAPVRASSWRRFDLGLECTNHSRGVAAPVDRSRTGVGGDSSGGWPHAFKNLLCSDRWLLLPGRSENYASLLGFQPGICYLILLNDCFMTDVVGLNWLLVNQQVEPLARSEYFVAWFLRSVVTFPEPEIANIALVYWVSNTLYRRK
ncbi:hypothetical protein GW17_00060615 [Ensete ventricosum]|nr:hypothetical protein GW17_00060615 [Ensete ventricosum]